MKLISLLAGALATGALAFGAPVFAQEDYPFTPDSLVQEGIAQGELTGPFEFHSDIFPGTVRRYWVHVPADYDATEPPNLLVFQDGQRATNPNGSLRIPTVLDNLIAAGDIPPTLGVFVTPGNLSESYPDDLGMSNPDHRWQEYDQLDDDYARMLTEELLPHIAETYAFSDDPARRLIGGTSSGAIAAFTVGWHRPEEFGNIISFIGSYTSIAYRPELDLPLEHGGNIYPTLIRKHDIRPLTIFLQDGANDIDNEHGNWFLANQQMLAALTYANRLADETGDTGPRYVVEHEWGTGGHSDQHGGAILPDVLRWFWGE
ncbi:alpha/beta hydrolase [Aquisalinus flavus]|uniref:Esterase n=1 Tax=Aquisalinus flavus TaxID=1526572 RepID=A0A8J2V5H0_9PROT|nr:alpha/beta hydrolase-fold protein [Aquisalinus flavus]MBD0427555.1 esterase family protein [Aquisalinus flavus]UNE47347.1 esterase family protein [Aquisalinus flavus]GGD01897.1 esterase [Aquisalinus flavus]